MTKSLDEMTKLKASLREILIQRGRTANDADDVVDIAALAASEAIQRMVEIVGNFDEGIRDVAIVLAINIIEKIALPGHKLGNKPDAIDWLPKPSFG